MTTTGLGRRSLRLDAVYCLVAGFLVMATAPVTSPVLDVHGGLIVTTGAVTIVWSLLLWGLARTPTPAVLRTVLAVNLVAVVVLVVASASVGSLLAIGLLLVAVDVGGFAASQVMALRQLRPA